MMKKILFFAGFLAFHFSVNAQNRLVLYEEFTGENCPPCAMYNPGLMDKVNANPNILIIKYQVPIPSGGPINAQNTADPEARRQYYSVNSAPWGQIDGMVGPGGSNPASLTSAHLSTAASVATNFTIDISNPDYGANNQLEFTVDITSTASLATANAVLHIALVESLHFDQAPGTNGEKDFHHVVRKMYPSPQGQAMPANWTANQTESISMSVDIPNYVNKNAETLFVVAWLQNVSTKEIYQAGKSENLPEIALDLASTKITLSNAPDLYCGIPTDIKPTITLKNAGSDLITSAKIFYRVVSSTNTGSWESQDWTGNLASDSEEEVTIINGIDGSLGRFFIEDSVAFPNNVEDINSFNNKSQILLTALNNETKTPFPIITDFESNVEDWIPFAYGNNEPLYIYNLGGKGYNGSNQALVYQNYGIQSGSGYMAFPFADVPGGEKALDFYVAYAQYQNENDKLEVVYSIDCGENWISVWSKAGSDLKTVEPRENSFIPANNNQWRKESVDVSEIPNDAQIAFKATSAYGNNLFIDNVNLRIGETDLSISEIVAGANIELYPNPVENQLNVTVDILKSAKATFTITNIVGQEVLESNQQLEMGKNQISFNTSSLTNGIYFLNILTKEGSLQKKFVVK